MIGVIGASHRTASLETLEKLSSLFFALRCHSGVLLQTCHRVEWYFSADNPSEWQEEFISAIRPHAEREMYSLFTLFGAECFYHLGRVTSGLDSLFIGETEIQGQVKAAYEAARIARTLSKELHFLFQKALHTGKVIRALLKKPFSNNLTSQVVQLVSTSLSCPSVLLIGASMTNRRIGAELVKRGMCVTVSNRTGEHAYTFAKTIGTEAIPWSVMKETWHQFPCVIAATKAPHYLLGPPAPNTQQLLIDLGVPRNIDPALGSAPRKLYNIESFTPEDQLKSDRATPIEATIDSLLGQRTQRDFISLLSKGRGGRGGGYWTGREGSAPEGGGPLHFIRSISLTTLLISGLCAGF